MKRDNDLIRAILLEIESWPPGGPARQIGPGRASPHRPRINFKIEGRQDNEVAEHLLIMRDAGLVDLPDIFRDSDGKIYEISVQRMTNAGHDFLAASHDSKVWQKVKEKAGSLALDSFTDLLKSYAKATAAAHLGIQL